MLGLNLLRTENMNYFALPTVKNLVMYQWRFFRPKLILFLFIPYLFYMVLYNVYAVYLFDAKIYELENEDDKRALVANIIVQILLFIMTAYSAYIEYKQIAFHREAYF